MVPDAGLVRGDFRGDQAALDRDGVEHTIVAGQRIVEIDTNMHRLGLSRLKVDQRPADLAHGQVGQSVVRLLQRIRRR